MTLLSFDISTIIYWTAVASWSAVFILSLLNVRRRHSKNFAELSAEFFVLATDILDDDRTTKEMANLVSFLSKRLCEPNFIRRFVVDYWFSPLRKNISRGDDDWITDINALPEEQRKKFDAAVTYAVLAFSFKNLLWGKIARSLIFPAIQISTLLRVKDRLPKTTHHESAIKVIFEMWKKRLAASKSVNRALS